MGGWVGGWVGGEVYTSIREDRRGFDNTNPTHASSHVYLNVFFLGWVGGWVGGRRRTLGRMGGVSMILILPTLLPM